MKNQVRAAFDAVHADDALLRDTMQYLRGQREQRRDRVRSGLSFRRTAMAAAAMLLLAVGISGYRWMQAPSAYLSIDVNPSVEFSMNRRDRIVGTYAYNDEGAEILNGVDLRGKRYEDAVALFLSAVESQGYLADGSLVSLSVQTTGVRGEKLRDSLTAAVRRQLERGSITADVEVFPVTPELREEASRCHMTATRYIAIQELLEVDPEATLEQYSHHSLQQIRGRTRECMQEHAAGGEGSEQGHGHGKGHGGGRGQGESGRP